MEDDQQIDTFGFEWDNHKRKLIQKFYTFLKSGTLVDCTLKAEGKALKIHKVVLSAYSPYFECLFSKHYDKHLVVTFQNIKFKELKAIIDLMYRGKIHISRDELTTLLKVAESLQIKGLLENKTTGSTESRLQKTVSQSTAPSLNIPHVSGLTIENNNVPRQTLEIPIRDLSEDSASPQVSKGLSSRKDSHLPSPTSRKRKRKRSLTEDSTVENQDASNSNDMPQQMGVPALGITPVAEENVHADSTDSLGRSALMTHLTKFVGIQLSEPNNNLIETRSEHLEEGVEDLMLDEDMNNLNDMEQDNNRAGPSHDPALHPAGGVVDSVTGAPGATDEVFLTQEANDNERSWTNAELEKYKIGNRFICFKCGKSFKRTGLQRHLKKNVCNKVEKCSNCNEDIPVNEIKKHNCNCHKRSRKRP